MKLGPLLSTLTFGVLVRALPRESRSQDSPEVTSDPWARLLLDQYGQCRLEFNTPGCKGLSEPFANYNKESQRCQRGENHPDLFSVCPNTPALMRDEGDYAGMAKLQFNLPVNPKNISFPVGFKPGCQAWVSSKDNDYMWTDPSCGIAMANLIKNGKRIGVKVPAEPGPSTTSVLPSATTTKSAASTPIPAVFTEKGPSKLWMGIYREGKHCILWSHFDECTGPSVPIGLYDAERNVCNANRNMITSEICGGNGDIALFYANSTEYDVQAGVLGMAVTEGSPRDRSTLWWPLGIKPGCQSWFNNDTNLYYSECDMDVDKFNSNSKILLSTLEPSATTWGLRATTWSRPHSSSTPASSSGVSSTPLARSSTPWAVSSTPLARSSTPWAVSSTPMARSSMTSSPYRMSSYPYRMTSSPFYKARPPTPVTRSSTPLVRSASTPVESVAAPVESVAAPVESIAAPVESIAAPVESVAASSEYFAAPSDSFTASSESSTASGVSSTPVARTSTPMTRSSTPLTRSATTSSGSSVTSSGPGTTSTLSSVTADIGF